MSEKPSPSGSQNLSFLMNFLLGGVSAGISKTVVAPLERVKIVMQTQDSLDSVRSGEAKKVTGVFKGIKQLSQTHGFLSLWRGNFVNVLRYVPTQAFNLAFVDVNRKILSSMKRYNPKTETGMYVASEIFAGGMAGAQSLVFVHPFDFARTRLSADTEKQFKGLSDLARKIYSTEGVKGFYRGFMISLSFSFVYRGAYLGFYNSAKTIFSGKTSLFERFLLAQFITVVAGTMVYPIDTIRRRLMMQAGRKQVHYSSSYQCSKTILKEEGILAFFKGGVSNIYRSIGGALVLVLYDQMTYLLTSSNQ